MYSRQDQFKEICSANKWKCTVQRRAVYDYLLKHEKSHPSVDTVCKGVKLAIPDISLDSIYRILGDFVEAGIAKKLESGKVFRYDINTMPHDHFYCVECGSLFDLDYSSPDTVADACRDIGQVLSYELEVKGVCYDCVQAHAHNEDN